MKQMTQEGQMELPEAAMLRGTTQPMPALPQRTAGGFGPGSSSARHRKPRPTYHVTGVAIVDAFFAFVDVVTFGHADWVQRLSSYLVIGGLAAVVNLLTLNAIINFVTFPGLSYRAHFAIAFLVATEVSMMANFIPNDRITFRRMPGSSRSWLMRCLRFHVTGIGGVIVTAVVSTTLHILLHVPLTRSQAIALIVAVVFNFTFHHLFTYRHVRERAA